MRFLVFIILFLTVQTSAAQFDLRKVPLSALPEDLQTLENVSIAFRWTDSLGDNVLVVSKRIVKSDEEDRVRVKGKLRSYNKQADRFTMQVIPSFASCYKIVLDS